MRRILPWNASLEKPVGADEAEALARAGMVGELRASAHAR